MLFATGLVAGGTLTGVFSSILKAIPATHDGKESDVLTVLQGIGEGLQESLGKAISLDLFSLIFYVAMGFVLVKVALKKADVAAEKR
jgi:hypothetical protein